jgi:chemotaxis protein methyltransferase WspC
MNLLAVEALVSDRLGIDPASLGSAVLPRAVETRMKLRHVASPQAYIAMLGAEVAEVDALVAELVVAETWFFRGGRSFFDRLAKFITGRAVKPVRILSVPCSTGEEPYSLAVALHDLHIPPEHYRIDAVDLAPEHLKRAALGRFTAFAFREAGTDIRPLYFRTSEDRWQIQPHFRHSIRFLFGNLIAPSFLVAESAYDLILCRNLFIYLTPDGRRRAMANLDRLLVRDGWLCLTPGEAERLPAGRFVQEGPLEFGIYRRNAVGSGVNTVAEATLTSTPASPAIPPSVPVAEPRFPPRGVVAPPARAQSHNPVAPLEAARALANAGQLVEALAACESVLRVETESADAYALLGVIHQAEGHFSEAAEALRRALYLAPDHPEALSHMLVICDRRGDTTQADAIRRHLARTAREETT